MKKFIFILLFPISLFCEEIINSNTPYFKHTPSTCNLSLHGSFLYYQPIEKNMDYAFFGSGGFNDERPVVYLDSNYQPGFKVGFGYIFHHDNWKMNFDYSRFNFSHSEKEDRAFWGSNLYPTWTTIERTGNLISSYVTADWNLDFNILDLEIERAFYLGDRTVLTPFYGLKGGFINQKLNSDFKTVVFYTGKINTKANSSLIGPKTGLNGKWELGAGFNIISSILAALMYQNSKVDFQEYDFRYSDTPLIVNNKSRLSQFISNIELSLGFSWSRFFNKKKKYIDLSAQYDFIYYSNQNNMRYLKDMLSSQVDSKTGALMLHGLDASLNFAF